MSKKKSHVIIKPYVITETMLKNLSIAERCLLDLMSGESEKAELEGRDPIPLTGPTWDRLKAKIAKKMRERKEKAKSQRGLWMSYYDRNPAVFAAITKLVAFP